MDRPIEHELHCSPRAIESVRSTMGACELVRRQTVGQLSNRQRPMLFGITVIALLLYIADVDIMTAVPYFIHTASDFRKAHADLFATSHIEVYGAGTLFLVVKSGVMRVLSHARLLRFLKRPKVIKQDAEHVKGPEILLVTTVFGPMTLIGDR